MREKGIALLFLAILLGGSLILAGGAYAVYRLSSPTNNSDIGATSQALESGTLDYEELGIEIYEDVDAEIAALKAMMEYIEAHQNDIYTEEQQDRDLAVSQETVKSQAQAVLNKNICQANLGDIEIAIETAESAQRTGLDDLSDQLMTWAKNGYTYYVSTVAYSWTDTYTDPILHKWAYHAQFAGMLGLESLFDMIINGHISLGGWLNQNCGTTQDEIIGSPPDTLIANTLSQNFCEADLQKVNDALKVMALAQKLGRDRDVELWEWIQNGFKAIVHRDHERWDEEQREYHASISQKLGMDILADQITEKKVKLENWYNETCTTDGAWSVTFSDQHYKNIPVTGTQGLDIYADITQMRAYSCDGLYSNWDGYKHIKTVMVDPWHEKVLSDDKEHFSFKLEKDDPKLRGNAITLKTTPPLTGHFSGPTEVTGTIVRGASECTAEEQEETDTDEDTNQDME